MPNGDNHPIITLSVYNILVYFLFKLRKLSVHPTFKEYVKNVKEHHVCTFCRKGCNPSSLHCIEFNRSEAISAFFLKILTHDIC